MSCCGHRVNRLLLLQPGVMFHAFQYSLAFQVLDDVAAYDRAKAALAAGDDELVPAVVTNAILDGERPVRVWRQHRELSQVQLAEAAGISQAYLAQIETGKREGTLSLYRSLAEALGVDLDDLVG